jgi:hypothetical protein
LPTAVAIRLPPLPAYHSAKMDLRAEIDRGEVVLARPELDKDGHKKWKPPVSDRPTLTLYARVGMRRYYLNDGTAPKLRGLSVEEWSVQRHDFRATRVIHFRG